MTHSLVDPQVKHEHLNWYDVILKQNYFLNNNNIIIQNDGLAVGAPSSSILAEIFLQYIQHTHTPHLSNAKT
jgi:hypothetical protein